MSAEYLDSMEIAPANDIYERLQEITRAVEEDIIGNVGEGPRITWLQTGGDSRGYGLDVRFDTEASLKDAAANGFLEKVANVAYAAVSNRLRLVETAEIQLSFNSDEYVHERGDAFARAHDGDWREDFILKLGSKGNPVSHA